MNLELVEDAKAVSSHSQYAFVLDPLVLSKKYDAIVVAVVHDQFKEISMDEYKRLSRNEMVVTDVKGIVPRPTWQL